MMMTIRYALIVVSKTLWIIFPGFWYYTSRCFTIGTRNPFDFTCQWPYKNRACLYSICLCANRACLCYYLIVFLRLDTTKTCTKNPFFKGIFLIAGGFYIGTTDGLRSTPRWRTSLFFFFFFFWVLQDLLDDRLSWRDMKQTLGHKLSGLR